MPSGGFPLQIAAIRLLFNELILITVNGKTGTGGIPLPEKAQVVPLRQPRGENHRRTLSVLLNFPYYLYHIARRGRLSLYQYGRQSSCGFAVIFHRYGYKTSGVMLRFIAWQLLDVLMLMAAALCHPGNYLQAMGRFVGLLEQLRGND